MEKRHHPSVTDLERKWRRVADLLCAPAKYANFFQMQRTDGRPYVECNGAVFAYVVKEGRREVERRTTSDLDEVLYWLASDLTWAMARDFEQSNRIAAQDFRRLMFQKQLELLAAIDRRWAERKWLEYGQVLAKHPYLDGRE